MVTAWAAGYMCGLCGRPRQYSDQNDEVFPQVEPTASTAQVQEHAPSITDKQPEGARENTAVYFEVLTADERLYKKEQAVEASDGSSSSSKVSVGPPDNLVPFLQPKLQHRQRRISSGPAEMWANTAGQESPLHHVVQAICSQIVMPAPTDKAPEATVQKGTDLLHSQLQATLRQLQQQCVVADSAVRKRLRPDQYTAVKLIDDAIETWLAASGNDIPSPHPSLQSLKPGLRATLLFPNSDHLGQLLVAKLWVGLERLRSGLQQGRSEGAFLQTALDAFAQGSQARLADVQEALLGSPDANDLAPLLAAMSDLLKSGPAPSQQCRRRFCCAIGELVYGMGRNQLEDWTPASVSALLVQALACSPLPALFTMWEWAVARGSAPDRTAATADTAHSTPERTAAAADMAHTTGNVQEETNIGRPGQTANSQDACMEDGTAASSDAGGATAAAGSTRAATTPGHDMAAEAAAAGIWAAPAAGQTHVSEADTADAARGGADVSEAAYAATLASVIFESLAAVSADANVAMEGTRGSSNAVVMLMHSYDLEMWEAWETALNIAARAMEHLQACRSRALAVNPLCQTALSAIEQQLYGSLELVMLSTAQHSRTSAPRSLVGTSRPAALTPSSSMGRYRTPSGSMTRHQGRNAAGYERALSNSSASCSTASYHSASGLPSCALGTFQPGAPVSMSESFLSARAGRASTSYNPATAGSTGNTFMATYPAPFGSSLAGVDMGMSGSFALLPSGYAVDSSAVYASTTSNITDSTNLVHRDHMIFLNLI